MPEVKPGQPGHALIAGASRSKATTRITSTIRFFRDVAAIRKQLATAPGLVGYTLRAQPLARDYRFGPAGSATCPGVTLARREIRNSRTWSRFSMALTLRRRRPAGETLPVHLSAVPPSRAPGAVSWSRGGLPARPGVPGPFASLEFAAEALAR